MSDLHITSVKRPQKIRIRVDDEEVVAFKGEIVYAALLTASQVNDASHGPLSVRMPVKPVSLESLSRSASR